MISEFYNICITELNNNEEDEINNIENDESIYSEED